MGYMKEICDEEGTFIKNMAFTKFMTCALDTKNRLWFFEDFPAKKNQALWTPDTIDYMLMKIEEGDEIDKMQEMI